jgi:hypothetical protein
MDQTHGSNLSEPAEARSLQHLTAPASRSAPQIRIHSTQNSSHGTQTALSLMSISPPETSKDPTYRFLLKCYHNPHLVKMFSNLSWTLSQEHNRNTFQEKLFSRICLDPEFSPYDIRPWLLHSLGSLSDMFYSPVKTRLDTSHPGRSYSNGSSTLHCLNKSYCLLTTFDSSTRQDSFLLSNDFLFHIIELFHPLKKQSRSFTRSRNEIRPCFPLMLLTDFCNSVSNTDRPLSILTSDHKAYAPKDNYDCYPAFTSVRAPFYSLRPQVFSILQNFFYGHDFSSDHHNDNYLRLANGNINIYPLWQRESYFEFRFTATFSLARAHQNFPILGCMHAKCSKSSCFSQTSDVNLLPIELRSTIFHESLKLRVKCQCHEIFSSRFADKCPIIFIVSVNLIDRLDARSTSIISGVVRLRTDVHDTHLYSCNIERSFRNASYCVDASHMRLPVLTHSGFKYPSITAEPYSKGFYSARYTPVNLDQYPICGSFRTISDSVLDD